MLSHGLRPDLLRLEQASPDDVVGGGVRRGDVSERGGDVGDEPGQEELLDFAPHGVVEVTRLGQGLEHARVQVPEVAAGERAGGDLLLELLLGGGELPLLLLAALLLGELALGLVLQPLDLGELGVAHHLELFLLLSDSGELLFLHELEHGDLKGLSDEDVEDGGHLEVKVEEVTALNLSLDVLAVLSGDEERAGGAVEECLGLRLDVRLDGAVRQLLKEVLGLDVHVGPALDRGRGARGCHTLEPPRLKAALPGVLISLIDLLLPLLLLCHYLGGVGIAANDS
mmetsp:Transcript_3999/g.8410  ORF Transcript_3999/g.8410 Transcript_3999/m.8410 type:complete len:284 (+) Transcript_3999:219-1070(+)